MVVVAFIQPPFLKIVQECVYCSNLTKRHKLAELQGIFLKNTIEEAHC